MKFLLLLALIWPTMAFAGIDHQSVDRVAEDLEQGDEHSLIARVLTYQIRVAERRLNMAGYHTEADELMEQWEYIYAPYVMGFVDELGDHPPLSQWVADKYDQIEAILGPEVMAFTHLDDIKIVNYAVPVVFEPCGVDWDEPEYKLHFVPLAGVASYWSAWGACMVGTCGAGFSLICTPVGTLTERFMVNVVAPPLSDKVYERRCVEH